MSGLRLSRCDPPLSTESWIIAEHMQGVEVGEDGGDGPATKGKPQAPVSSQKVGRLQEEDPGGGKTKPNLTKTGTSHNGGTVSRV